ncbi:MAG: 50S ribosomal protein L6 [Clostridia bacterium]|nr:50S ribosomal protein L6 [Clostridia bacterium]
MSRIGREPITVPAGVSVNVAEGNVVTVKGPLGELNQTFAAQLTIAQEGDKLTVTRPNDQKENRALHGLTRTLLNNMVVGVSKGYEKQLEIVGVGYRAEKQGKKLVLGLGYSHPVVFEEADGITFELPNNTTIIVKGIDKQAVGQVAAVIRSKRPPEPYLGKGIKYTGERIRRKAGKAGKGK